MKKISGIQWFRMAVLTFFLVIITITAIRHQVLGGGPAGSPPVDAICPFGGVESIYKFIAGGEFLKRTYMSNIVLLSGTVILAVVFGRFFCGWICALGWMQELSGKLGRLVFRKRFIIPLVVDKPLRYLKYVILAVILFFTWKMGEMVVRPYDPLAAYSHIFAGFEELAGGFLIGAIVLAGSLLLSMLYDRFFCKYMCPMGAFLGILDKMSLFRIKRDTTTCTNCNLCTKACPVNIDVAKIDQVNSAECLSCMECVTACPTKKETLRTTAAGKFIKPAIIGIAGILIYLGLVGATHLTGVWKVSEESLTDVVKNEGKLDPYSIRGFMTLKDISVTFGIELHRLYKELGLMEAVVPETTKMKELSVFNELVNEEFVRDTVARIIGVPEKEDSETDNADSGKKLTGSDTQQDNNIPDPALIKGTMTIREICETYKVDKNELYKKIKIPDMNFPETSTGRELRELMSKTDPAFEMEAVREAVRELNGLK